MRACGIVWIGLMCGAAAAQTLEPVPHPVPRMPLRGAPTIPADTAAVLIGLAARAGVIFAGQVVEVRRNDAAGFVDVVFRVERAVRGLARGGSAPTTYVLREWAGLWTGEATRYVVGQRLLMLLAARGPSGMSSPVGGRAGMMPLVGTRQPPLARGTGVAPADSGAEERQEEAVDLRWVQAQAMRKSNVVGQSGTWQSETGRNAAGQRERDEQELIWRVPWRGPVAPIQTAAAPGPSLSAVLALLGQADGR